MTSIKALTDFSGPPAIKYKTVQKPQKAARSEQVIMIFFFFRIQNKYANSPEIIKPGMDQNGV